MTDLVPPRLRDDCFAMPQGVYWVPVDDAIQRLQQVLHPTTGIHEISVDHACGRVLAAEVQALRANPPRANSAVDGYGFRADCTGAGVQKLPLVSGRAAAGTPFDGAVPAGAAVRILTGAIVPEGVDTVVLEEDCAVNDTAIAFDGPVRPGANIRRAGEDFDTGARLLPAGHIVRPGDLALLCAAGIKTVSVRDVLRVGVLSTGDELVRAGTLPVADHQIYDANRPMLLSLINGWGHQPVDLGHVGDDRAKIQAVFDTAQVDMILTSGGASAGDEDHVSRLLRDKGTLSSWRIALKPGRPLALAMWNGIPIFGLPGNPVAAFVCAAIFGRPAMQVLAGGTWAVPRGVTVPAAFSKRKKPGRREYLRARLVDGAAQVFASEGSGRISGLSWADGFVELPDGAMTVTPGTPVTYISYASLGIG